MVTRTLMLVRHGMPEDVATVDPVGPGLSALGRTQAGLVAERLSPLPVRALYTSHLRRAVETAAIISAALPGVPLTTAPELAECLPGVPGELDGQFRHIPSERWERDRQQLDAAIQRFVRPAATGDNVDVLVCHGNIMRAVMMRVLRVPVEHWVYADVYCCGLSEIHIAADGTARLVAHNDTGHLPAELKTF